MQSHAARHAVSEHLHDRATAAPGTADAAAGGGTASSGVQVSEAFGRRCLPKLLGVLGDAGATPRDRATALHVLNTHLADQEAKVEALAAGAPAALVACLLGLPAAASGADAAGAGAGAGDDSTTRQQQLCCAALEALCVLPQGRAAVTAAAGLQALAAALPTVPDAAAAALKAFVLSSDGVAALQRSPAPLIPSLVDSLGRPATSLAAAADVAAVLAGIASTDAGVAAACASGVPAAMVTLLRRMLRFKLEGAVARVVVEAAACLRLLAHHPDGKTQLRQAGGIEVLAAALKAPSPPPQLPALAAGALASIAVDAAAKLPVMAAAAPVLVALLSGGDAGAAGCAAAALRLALESLEARRKLEGLMTPGQMEAALGKLPDAPPGYRYVVTIPAAE